MTSDELREVRQKILGLLEESGMKNVKVDMGVEIGSPWLMDAPPNMFKVTMGISGVIDSLTILD